MSGFWFSFIYFLFKWATGDVAPQVSVALKAEGEGHGVTKRRALIFVAGSSAQKKHLWQTPPSLG